MAGFIFASGATGQSNIYCQLRSLNTGLIANGVGMESYLEGHWTSYVNNTPEQPGSGEYELNVPGYLPAGIYKATFFVPLGGIPAFGDTPFDTETFAWDGANILYLGSSLNVGSINGSATAAVNLGLSANAFVVGSAAAGTLSGTQMTTNLIATVPNIYAGRTLYFTAGVNMGLAMLITGYAVTGGLLTLIAYNNAPAPSAPSVGDTFLVI